MYNATDYVRRTEFASVLVIDYEIVCFGPSERHSSFGKCLFEVDIIT